MAMASSAPSPVFSCAQCRRAISIDDSLLAVDMETFFHEQQSSGDGAHTAGAVRVSAAQKRESLVAGPLSDRSSSVFARESFSVDDATAAIHVDLMGAMAEGQLERAAAAFELASLHTRSEQPLCGECVRIVLARIRKSAMEERAVRDAYVSFLRQAVAEDADVPDEAALAAEMLAMRTEETVLKGELAQLKAEREDVAASLAALAEDEAELAAMEAAYWADYNTFIAQVDQFIVERDAVRRAHDVAEESLRALICANVLNDAFHIWHDGPMGTINTYRLGRLPTISVPWEEINAAWGQAALLLATLARKVRFEFVEFSIHHMGSQTKLVRKSGGAVLELFGSETSLGKKLLGGNRSFDKAMVAFLSCIRELAYVVRQRDPTLELPYAIDDHKIGLAHGEMVSIRFSSALEQWTKACKFTLSVLKKLLSSIIKE